MEYTQWAFKFYDFTIEELVLILVVMEYTQWGNDNPLLGAMFGS